MLASLLLFFSSLFTSSSDVDVQEPKKSPLYQFEYRTPTTIEASLDVSRYKSVDTAYAQKSFFLKDIKLFTGQCSIQSTTLVNGIDIGEIDTLRFSITFENPCKLNQFTLNALVEMKNRVVMNSKVYEATKEERLGPITFVNKSPFKTLEYFVTIAPRDGNSSVAAYSDKRFIYQIKDKLGFDLSSESVKSVKIRVLDAQKLALRDGEELVNEIELSGGAGEFTVHSYGVLGQAALELRAYIVDEYGFVDEIKEIYSLNIVQNEELNVARSEYRVVISAKDGNYNLLANEKKRFEYQIVNDAGEEIADSQIKSIYIRTYNGKVAQLIQKSDANETLVSELFIEDGARANGEIFVQAGEESGTTKIEVVVTFDLNGAEFTKRGVISLRVEGLPEAPYKLVLKFDGESFVLERNYAVRYAIVSKTTGHFIQRENIESIHFKIEGENALFVDRSGKEHQELMLEGEEVQSSGFIFLRAKKVGEVKIVAQAKIKKDANILENRLVVPVVLNENNKIVLEYSGTEYEESTGYFVDTYTIRIKDKKYDGEILEVGAITPKILYPHIYYTKFLEGKLDPYNPEYTQNLKYIYYRDIGNEYDGRLFKKDNKLLFAVNDPYASRRLNMFEVSPGSDKLVILPNKMSNSLSYLGKWEIANVESESTLLVQGDIFEDVDNLSYVIGDESRYNPVQDTIASLLLDKSRYVIEDGIVQIRIYYPTFFAGKDIFIYANINDGKERIGNVYKRTLTGIDLEATQPMKCKSYVCARRVKLYYPNANKPLQYSRFAARCEGDNIRYLYFTSTLSSCASMPQYGVDINQKTDGNGEVIMCIYPQEIYQEVDNNETSGGTGKQLVPTGEYEEVAPTCEYTVAEEFPY